MRSFLVRVSLVAGVIATTSPILAGDGSNRVVARAGADSGVCPAAPGPGCEARPSPPSRLSVIRGALRHQRRDPFGPFGHRASDEAPRLARLIRLAADGRRPRFPRWRREAIVSGTGAAMTRGHGRFAWMTAPVRTDRPLLPYWTPDPDRWGGVQEMAMATESCGCLDGPGPGSVPDGSDVPGVPLVVTKGIAAALDLTWDPACGGASDYAVHEGAIGSWYSHDPDTCTTGGALTHTLTPAPGGRYYLVVPLDATEEGSYGTDANGTERPPAAAACRPQVLDPCP